ncbi:DUF1517 domain-containing protein [Alkalinema sp. FACHB-956]|uniref:DUF1517 domain-containing protein n=1 Tax=Alkalinema sp. FACHB-956 TaxID=2692768 RepID=UPI0016889E54|nr:DUF1517 domain-containing protein [Alkalinema sp. FACHB-956]MBD2329022.1 DUF1517 domain-containing protein [Alkalinema sp. FACHB-956]
MNSWHDRFNSLTGRDRLVVCRLFIHFKGQEVTPLLGVLNQAGRNAAFAEGDLATLGSGLIQICQSLLQHQTYWYAAANEGDVFWSEGEAEQLVNELFMDSAQRYLSDLPPEEPAADTPLSLPISHNLVVMITVAFEGEDPHLETDLADLNALKQGLLSLTNLVEQNRLRAIQVHFSPAQMGDELTEDQVLQQFPELIPL